MLSCDTLAIAKTKNIYGENLFAKNSDRPLGEAQPLFYAPAAQYPEGAALQTTNLVIPQAERTYAVLGSRPYWIWGFEMGVNECGVVIGNEAQGSRNAAEAEEGLLGMDLLRLGLERGGTAREALEVITTLLEHFGQNANASPLFDRRYENSFMLADSNEIWLLETAGREWAAKRIDSAQGISNCYAIRDDYDLLSANAAAVAEKNGWKRPGKLDFAESYTLSAPRQSASVPRFRRLQKKIAESGDLHDLSTVKSILRDHFEGELIEPRFGAFNAVFSTICMHANRWDAAQTAASWIVRSGDDGMKLRVCFSLPCVSAYLPVSVTGALPDAMTSGGEFYDPDALWWRMERLAMLVSLDEARCAPRVISALRSFEADAELRAQAVETVGGDLRELTAECCTELMALAERLAEETAACLRKNGGVTGPRAEFVCEYAQRVRMPLI